MSYSNKSIGNLKHIVPKNNFIILSKQIFTDPDLEPYDIKILGYLLTHAETWHITKEQIQEDTKLNPKTITKSFHRLELLGYLKVTKVSKGKGKGFDYLYITSSEKSLIQDTAKGNLETIQDTVSVPIQDTARRCLLKPTDNKDSKIEPSHSDSYTRHRQTVPIYNTSIDKTNNKKEEEKIYKKETEIVETDKCNKDYIFLDSTKEEIEPSITIQDTDLENKVIEVEIENISEPETIQEVKMDAEQFKNNLIKQIKEKLNLFEDPNKLISKYSLEEVSKHLSYVDYFETNRLHEKVKDNLTVLFLNSLKSNSAPPLAFVNEQIEKQHRDKETLLEHASNIIGVRSMGREQRIVEIIQELTKEYQSYNTKLDTFLKEGIQTANNKRKRLKQYELSLIEKSHLTEDLTKKWNDKKYLTIRLCKQLVMIDIKKLFIAMKILLNQDRYLTQSFKSELQLFDNSLDKMFLTLENFILINSHKELENAETY